MNRSATLVALLLVVAGSVLEARTWTSSDGKTLEAEFVSSTDTHVTIKRDSDGKVFKLPLDRLSEKDREYAREALQPESVEEEKAEAVAIGGEYAHLITGDWALAAHGNLPYALYGSKDLDGARKYPLVISLHGKSDNNENGKQIGQAQAFAKPDNYSERPCLILAPLCYQPHGGTGGGWSDDPGTETLRLVKDLVKKLPLVDPDRIYVIGYSMGGYGTWRFLLEEPRLFAAGVPIAGGMHGDVGKLRKMPIWSFHGAKDTVVPPDSARSCADQLKRSKVFKYTEYPEEGHGIAGRVTQDPELHKWLFAQKRQ